MVRNFSQNYTIAQNIKVNGFNDLIQSMKGFNENILTLDLFGLRKSSFVLLEQIEYCLNNENNSSIFSGLEMMKDEISSINELLNFNKFIRYCAFIKLSEKMSQKGYLLNAIALLFEASKEFMLYKISDNEPLFTNLEGKDRYIKLQDITHWLNDEKLDFKNFKILKEYLHHKINLENSYNDWYKKLKELLDNNHDILKYIKKHAKKELNQDDNTHISDLIDKAKNGNKKEFDDLFKHTKNKIVNKTYNIESSKNYHDQNSINYKKFFNKIRKIRNSLSHVKTANNNSVLTQNQFENLKNELIKSIKNLK